MESQLVLAFFICNLGVFHSISTHRCGLDCLAAFQSSWDGLPHRYFSIAHFYLLQLNKQAIDTFAQKAYNAGIINCFYIIFRVKFNCFLHVSRLHACCAHLLSISLSVEKRRKPNIYKSIHVLREYDRMSHTPDPLHFGSVFHHVVFGIRIRVLIQFPNWYHRHSHWVFCFMLNARAFGSVYTYMALCKWYFVYKHRM